MVVDLPVEFFADIFARNVSSYRVELERALVERVGDLAVVTTRELNLEHFAESGACSIQLQTVPRPGLNHSWGGEDHDQIVQRVTNGLWEVKWQDAVLHVLTAGWQTSCGSEHASWVIAESGTIAKEFILTVARQTNHPGDAILVFGEGHWQRSRELFEAVRRSSFDDLILDSTLKASIRADFKQFLEARHRYDEIGVAWRRGALLVGPPGNGKTHCVRALVKELDVPALYVRSLKHRYFESEDLLKMVFDRVRELRPCILILEDLDSLIDERNQSFFLNQLDGFEKNEGMIVLATTNHPERIDPAIVDRPSRFDRKYHFPLPGRDQRVEFLQCWRRKLADNVEWATSHIETVADSTEGFSFAYLKELVMSGLLNWIADPHQSLANHLTAQCELLASQMQSNKPSASPEISGPPSDLPR